MTKYLFSLFQLFLQTILRLVIVLGLSFGFNLFFIPGAIATPTINLTKQPAEEIIINLSNSANELQFFPNKLEFLAGHRYKLILKNSSLSKHYFTAKNFADAIWTQKVDAGNVEIKGAIHELELKPGAEAEWVFLPIKSGNYSLRCTIPGHTEAGMTGQIIIADREIN